MKDFIAPDLVNIEDTGEGIYAGSGAWNTNPDIPNPPFPPGDDASSDWVWNCKWTGHNHGGHSVCHVLGQHCGNKCGESITLNIVTNFTIREVKNASGYTITNLGSHSFSIVRNGHFNPNESVGFNFEIVTSDPMYDENGNALHGAIGAHNAHDKYCKVVSTT